MIMRENETKDVVVQEEGQESRGMVVHQSNLVSEDAFQMTIEQAHNLITKERMMYDLVRKVASELLEGSDKYYMSQLSAKNWKGPKPDEVPVLKKKGVDKLLTFFKIGMFPEIEKIDGGYQVTVIGRDRTGGYIGTGKGICTRFEKKFAWIKASDSEYADANEDERRINVATYGNNTYKNKQIKTDERSMAHTLVSMAEKRARAAFLRKLMPDLDDVSFEGEAHESDFNYDDIKTDVSPDKQVMAESEIAAFYEVLKKKYRVQDIKEAFREITGDEKLGGTTEGQSLDITTYLQDNFGGAKNEQSNS
jgi:hypothetical protein